MTAPEGPPEASGDLWEDMVTRHDDLLLEILHRAEAEFEATHGPGKESDRRPPPSSPPGDPDPGEAEAYDTRSSTPDEAPPEDPPPSDRPDPPGDAKPEDPEPGPRPAPEFGGGGGGGGDDPVPRRRTKTPQKQRPKLRRSVLATFAVLAVLCYLMLGEGEDEASDDATSQSPDAAAAVPVPGSRPRGPSPSPEIIPESAFMRFAVETTRRPHDAPGRARATPPLRWRPKRPGSDPAPAAGGRPSEPSRGEVLPRSRKERILEFMDDAMSAFENLVTGE